MAETNKTIIEQLNDLAIDFCNNYCKYPLMDIPEGKDEDWLFNDDDSPCMTCPLSMIS